MRLIGTCLLTVLFNVATMATNNIVYCFEIKNPAALQHAKEIEQDLRGLKGLHSSTWELKNERICIVADQETLCQDDVLRVLNIRSEKDKQPFFAIYEIPPLEKATEAFRSTLDAFEKEFKKGGKDKTTLTLQLQLQRRYEEFFAVLKDEENKGVTAGQPAPESPLVGRAKIVGRFVLLNGEFMSRDLVGRIENNILETREQFESLVKDIEKTKADRTSQSAERG